MKGETKNPKHSEMAAWVQKCQSLEMDATRRKEEADSLATKLSWLISNVLTESQLDMSFPGDKITIRYYAGRLGNE